MLYIFDGYGRFTSQIFISQRLWTFIRLITLFLGVYECSYITYLHFLMFLNILRLRLLFIDEYKCFTSTTFIPWQLRAFHVETLSFLAIMNVSHQNPCFLGSYERFFVIKNSFNERRFFSNLSSILTYKNNMVINEK